MSVGMLARMSFGWCVYVRMLLGIYVGVYACWSVHIYVCRAGMDVCRSVCRSAIGMCVFMSVIGMYVCRSVSMHEGM